MSAMEFLRDVGKYFTVNYLLAKESVKRRLESEDGISYTEFSYSLLQAYDFLLLHDRSRARCNWAKRSMGQCCRGCDLIRKLRGKQAHGLVLPLLTTAGGTKFGENGGRTIWLDPGKTSPFRFYQFWLNAEDRDVVPYLKYFTFRTRAEIEELEQELKSHPEQRHAQRALARDVTQMVHAPITRRAPTRGGVPVWRVGGGRVGRRHPDGLRRCAIHYDDRSGVGGRVWRRFQIAVSTAWRLRRPRRVVSLSRGDSTSTIGGSPTRVETITIADAISRSVIVLRKASGSVGFVKIEG